MVANKKCGVALVEIRDVVRVWIEFRAPRKGDLMWAVPCDATPAEALDEVLCGRDDHRAGIVGFGYFATHNEPEFDDQMSDDPDDWLRNVVVHVEHVATVPSEGAPTKPWPDLTPHIKLL